MWTWNSDPFGTDAANPNPAGAGAFTYNLRFPGQLFDGQAGLHSNYFRDFDPAVGRYVESDLIGLGGGINTYAYVSGEPLTRRDATGLAPGDSFSSPQAAAIDALNYISSKKDRCAREYGGWVYKKWTLFGAPKYTYDEPTGLGQTGGDLGPLQPVFHGTYAIFHNHPMLPGYAYDEFSPPDQDTAETYGIPSYLLTPTGPILRYLPYRRFPKAGGVTSVGQSPCGCKN